MSYVEARARRVKQSSQSKKKFVCVPLVAPICGVHPNFSWALDWKKVADMVGVDFDKGPFGALPPAPDPNRSLLRRHIDSTEASDWLSGILSHFQPRRSPTTSHCLKHTALGWLSRFGVHGKTQTVLAHHSTGPMTNLAETRSVAPASTCPDAGPLQEKTFLLIVIITIIILRIAITIIIIIMLLLYYHCYGWSLFLQLLFLFFCRSKNQSSQSEARFEPG